MLNRCLIRAWAKRDGIQVESPGRAECTMAGPDTAILLDMDHRLPGWLEAALTRLDASGGTAPVAAHGYGPDGELLRGRGVDVHPRLRSQDLAAFASAVMSCEPSPERNGCDDLTWVNLG